jgi:hypothetical protein
MNKEQNERKHNAFFFQMTDILTLRFDTKVAWFVWIFLLYFCSFSTIPDELCFSLSRKEHLL